MHRYSVYGKCLASELELPNLTPSPTPRSDWTFRVGRAIPHLEEARLIGHDRIEGIGIRLLKHSNGYRFEFDDTGIFDLSKDGRDIWWYEKAEVDMDLLCADFTGRVLAAALHVWGKLTLHGSAVVLGVEGVAFLAPKGYGKSTLTLALTAAGARLSSDDMVTVDCAVPVTAWPGLDSVRLWRQSVDALDVEGLSMAIGAGRKFILSRFPEEKLVRNCFSLSAVYLLNPVAAIPDSEAAAIRTRLDPVSALMSLVTNTKLGPLMGDTEAAVVLQRAANLTRHVPVYRLTIVRDLKRLGEVVGQVCGWHEVAQVTNPLLECAS